MATTEKSLATVPRGLLYETTYTPVPVFVTVIPEDPVILSPAAETLPDKT